MNPKRSRSFTSSITDLKFRFNILDKSIAGDYEINSYQKEPNSSGSNNPYENIIHKKKMYPRQFFVCARSNQGPT